MNPECRAVFADWSGGCVDLNHAGPDVGIADRHSPGAGRPLRGGGDPHRGCWGLWRDFTKGAIPVLTWGGLRGGISVALALSLPAGTEKDAIVTVCYAVVVFSILVQGMTIGRLVAWVVPAQDEVSGHD